MQLPVILTVHPSRRLATLLLVAHGLALAVLTALSIPDLFRLAMVMLVCGSAVLFWRRAHGRGQITRLVLRADGKIEFTRCNGETGEALTHPHTTVMPQLTLLLLRCGKRVEALVLLPDSLPSEEFRRLRLWLRWQAEASD